MNDQNDIQAIREIFYRMMKDKELTIEEVRHLATAGYGFICEHNRELEKVYSIIGQMWSI